MLNRYHFCYLHLHKTPTCTGVAAVRVPLNWASTAASKYQSWRAFTLNTCNTYTQNTFGLSQSDITLTNITILNNLNSRMLPGYLSGWRAHT